MASTFSPSLRIELIGDGDQSGIWGQTTNNNLGTLIEQAISGVVTITMTDANYTLTSFNGVSDEARNMVLVLSGTNTQQRNVIAPLVEKTYIVRNSTAGGQAVQIIGASGTGVIVPNGSTVQVYCDGTNFNAVNTGATGNFNIAGNLTVSGTTTLTGALSGSTAVFSGAISSVSPTFTGTPTAPTAANGTNTTQIATTAFVQNFATTLGTMSTQNANNVNITGGNMTGMTSIAGGTVSGTTITASTQFTGPGTGLTGTAAALNIGGNAGTVTNGVVTTGSYNDPSWIASLAGAKISGTVANATNAVNATGATQNSITSIPNLATVGTITSGTWSGSFGAVSGANLTNLNASNLGSGTVPAARLTGTYNINISGNAGTATTATNSTQLQGKTKLGLGTTGEVWNDVTGSRSAGTTYTNNFTYPIAVIMQVGAQTNGIYIYLNGSLVIRHWYDVNGGAGQVGYSSGMIIVPPGGTYTCTNGPLRLWWELY